MMDQRLRFQRMLSTHTSQPDAGSRWQTLARGSSDLLLGSPQNLRPASGLNLISCLTLYHVGSASSKSFAIVAIASVFQSFGRSRYDSRQTIHAH